MVINLKVRVLLILFAFFTAFSVTSSKFALAADSGSDVSSADGAMCNAYGIFKGPLGKTFAVFAIVALGVGFFLGKVSWGTAIAIALGIGAIFGAPTLVTTLTGGTGVCSGA